ncbi:MAG: flagellar basal body P-ring formation chaperone FlgA [Acidobacteriia bacterium]|nr:flagellar basal body P-ring formation chaperone FlgA [Terriglobia bacterium]
MIPLAEVALAGCLAVGAGSDRVLVRDLAPAVPAFAAAPPDAPLGFAPAPGAQRIFHPAELRRLAARLGLDAAPGDDVCVERRTAPLDAARVLESMREQMPGARIEILEISRQPAPQGRLQFPLSGLRPTPAGEFWSGSVLYAGNRRFAVWAKVRVRALEPRVIALAALKPGRAIDAAAVRLEMREVFPAPPQIFAASEEDVAGRLPRRTVAAGTAVLLPWLEPPRDVRRGDVVRVVSRYGAALIEAEGVAQASGSAGDRIPVLNPRSNKRFPARVMGKGAVSVGKEGSL